MSGYTKRQGSEVKTILKTLLLLLLLSIVATACGGSKISLPTNCIHIRFDDFTEKGSNTDILGTVTNDCEKDISKATILVTCYDMNKNAVDDDSANVKNVASGDTAQFTVTINATKEQTTNCQPEVESVKFK